MDTANQKHLSITSEQELPQRIIPRSERRARDRYAQKQGFPDMAAYMKAQSENATKVWMNKGIQQQAFIVMGKVLTQLLGRTPTEADTDDADLLVPLIGQDQQAYSFYFKGKKLGVIRIDITTDPTKCKITFEPGEEFNGKADA